MKNNNKQKFSEILKNYQEDIEYLLDEILMYFDYNNDYIIFINLFVEFKKYDCWKDVLSLDKYNKCFNKIYYIDEEYHYKINCYIAIFKFSCLNNQEATQKYRENYYLKLFKNAKLIMKDVEFEAINFDEDSSKILFEILINVMNISNDKKSRLAIELKVNKLIEENIADLIKLNYNNFFISLKYFNQFLDLIKEKDLCNKALITLDKISFKIKVVDFLAENFIVTPLKLYNYLYSVLYSKIYSYKKDITDYKHVINLKLNQSFFYTGIFINNNENMYDLPIAVDNGENDKLPYIYKLTMFLIKSFFARPIYCLSPIINLFKNNENKISINYNNQNSEIILNEGRSCWFIGIKQNKVELICNDSNQHSQERRR